MKEVILYRYFKITKICPASLFIQVNLGYSKMGKLYRIRIIDGYNVLVISLKVFRHGHTDRVPHATAIFLTMDASGMPLRKDEVL